MLDVDVDSARVLAVGVAEDHAAVLERAGLSVDATPDAAACLDCLDERIDCIVSTYRLDGTDGVELLRAVREDHPDLPFVLVARDGDETVASEAIAAGVTDYVPVEGTPSALAARVLDAVEEHRAREVDEVYERISDAFYAVDESFRFTYVNERAEELLQADAEDLLGECLWDEFPGATETEAYDAFHEALETQRPTEYELYYDPLDFWVQARVYPSDTGLSVFFRDVTEQKEREQALERAEERFRTVFEQSHDAIYINDPYADEIVDANPAGCEMLGYTREELLSLGPSDCHPDEMDRFESFVDGVFAEGSGWTDELTCLTRDGRKLPVEMSASRIEIDGRPMMLVNVRDISERKERERELERAERRFEATFDSPTTYMALLAPDGTVRRVNQAALDLADVDEADVVGEPLWETPWYADAGTRAELREAIERAADGEYVRSETRVEPSEGPPIYVNAAVEPVVENGEVVSLLASARDVTERRARERALRDAHDVFVATDMSFDDRVDALLEIARQAIGTEYATLSRIEDDTYIFESMEAPADADLQSGDTVALEATNCDRVAATEETLVLHDVAAEAPELADRAGNAELGIASYLGAPVVVDGEVYGTFCFYDMEARPEEFAEWEVTFVDLLSNWLEHELERRRTTERLAALNDLNAVVRDINQALAEQSSREEVEQVVCDRLAGSDSYEFAWVGTVDERTGEVVPSATANTRGYLESVTITADDSETGQGPTGRALRTGTTQVVQNIGDADGYEPWREAATDRGVGASVAIPIVYEGETYGVLNVYSARKDAFDGEERAVVSQLGEIMGLSIAVTEHEHELSHERERLEFVNRLIRHNMLNSLNVVQARTELLDRHTPPEGEQHLELVRERTDGMIDLIETLRSLMHAIVEKEDHELEPVDLGTVLRTQVRQAREEFDGAVFELRDGVADAGSVMADELLGEVFENLLTNAVQHNDADVPRVTVDVETDVETATVRVTDNGPGISDDLKQRIFEGGEGNIGSPGSGFGLYLVRETVEMYGGTVSVEAADPSGTTFAVELPRAAGPQNDASGGAVRESERT